MPEAYRAAFAEVTADRSARHLERFRLERAFKIPKPYELVTADQAKEFGVLGSSPGRSTNEVDLFRGATDLMTLGNVYFDKKRTLAAVYTWASCGNLCGFGTGAISSKMGKATGTSSTGPIA